MLNSSSWNELGIFDPLVFTGVQMMNTGKEINDKRENQI